MGFHFVVMFIDYFMDDERQPYVHLVPGADIKPHNV
jgi:hypothetical protein